MRVLQEQELSVLGSSPEQLNRRIARASSRKRQGGAVALMVGLVLSLALLGFAALAIDVANLMVVRNELQNAADAAALAGAQCLFRRTECANSTNPTPDWSTAQTRASGAIALNQSQGRSLSIGDVDYGYWNITGSPNYLQSVPMTPTPNDLPAIRVTISKASGSNEGEVRVVFARVRSVPVSATAIAVVPYAGYVGPYVLFPIVINDCMYARYWDSAQGAPKTATSTSDPFNPKNTIPQTIGQPYIFRIYSEYHGESCEAGQWTTFADKKDDVATMRALISGHAPIALKIGDETYVQPGTKETVYDSDLHPSVNACSAQGNKSCEYVIVPVVTDVTKGFQSVVGFACLHIDFAVGGNDKYIQVEMSNNPEHCTVPDSSGSGPNYGATSPPRIAR